MEDSLTMTEEKLKRYYQLNKQKKEIEQEINLLKKLFHESLDQTIGKSKKGEIECGKYKIQRQIRQSISYRNEEAVQKLVDLNLKEFIQVIKRPDKDKLEAAFKLGLVNEKDFEEYKQTRITQAIIVKENFD